jgi:hypothetical protein
MAGLAAAVITQKDLAVREKTDKQGATKAAKVTAATRLEGEGRKM